MFGVGIQSGLLSFRMFEAEFGADGDPVPDGGQCFSRQFFIDEWPIFCGVEKRDAILTA